MNVHNPTEGYELAGILIGDDGGLSILTYNWKFEVKVPGVVFAELGLFDESREGFDWDEDSDRAAEILEMKLNMAGRLIHDRDDFGKQVRKATQPGAPIASPLYIRISTQD